MAEVDAGVLDLEGDVTLAANVDTVSESLVLRVLGTAQDGGEGLGLIKADLVFPSLLVPLLACDCICGFGPLPEPAPCSAEWWGAAVICRLAG
jgi:hypothetical protein